MCLIPQEIAVVECDDDVRRRSECSEKYRKIQTDSLRCGHPRQVLGDASPLSLAS